jgi:membrane protease YdiL (CAAX protease family)
VDQELHEGTKTPLSSGDRGHLLELSAIFFLLLAPTLFYFLTGGTRQSDSELTVVSLVPDMLMRIGWCTLVPLLLARGGSFDWKLPRSGAEWGKEIGWGVLLILAIWGCALVIGLIVNTFGLNETQELAQPTPNRSAMTALLLFTPVIGLDEELLFRVYLQTRLTQVMRSKRMLPVFLASALFASVHGYPLAGTLTILVFGLVLGFSYQANGKVPRLVVAHTLWNIGVIGLGLLSG